MAGAKVNFWAVKPGRLFVDFARALHSRGADFSIDGHTGYQYDPEHDTPILREVVLYLIENPLMGVHRIEVVDRSRLVVHYSLAFEASEIEGFICDILWALYDGVHPIVTHREGELPAEVAEDEPVA